MEQYPYFTEELLESLLPKKASIFLTKCRDHITLLCVDNEPLFFQSFEGPYIPTLRTLHKFPEMMRMVRVDTGAIKYLLQGADVMCPGLTSAGGHIDADLPQGAIVAVMAQEKEHALAIGRLNMSSQEMYPSHQMGIERSNCA